jgi:hypothetical protein
MYAFAVADLILDDPKYKNLKYKCLWFGLEESIEEFEASILQYALSKYYQKYITQDELLSRTEPLSEDIINLIKSDCIQKYFHLCKDLIDFDETTSNPTGIYYKCQKYSNEVGTHFTKTININGVDTKVYSHYEMKDPDLIVAVVIDNVNILTPEKSELGSVLDLGGTIGKMVDDYARKQMTKHWKFHVCCVQQQQMAGGNIEHMKAGKLEPDSMKLGDNIKVARSYQVIIGLYSPYKHKIATYFNYQILNSPSKEGLEDCFRSLHIIKNRFGRTGTVEPLFFNPKGFSFENLPKPNNEEDLKRYILNKNLILKYE